MSTRRDEDDFARELEAHLALETDRLIDEGVPPEEARHLARRRFGSVTAVREHFYESRRTIWLDQLVQDFRQGFRSLRRYPVAAGVAVISLALGIGATTATLTVRDVLFRKPPPLYRESSQLSRLQLGTLRQPLRPDSAIPGPLFEHWRHATLAATLAAATPTRVVEYRTADRADTIRLRKGTQNVFTVLGVDAAVGSAVLTPAAVVLSDRVWRTVFDQRPDVVGSAIWIEGTPYVVAGVMPERFWFSSTDSAIWTLLAPGAASGEARVEVVARRDPGVTPAALLTQLQSGVAAYVAGLPAGERDARLAIAGIEGTPISRAVAVALPWVLAVAVLLTLLIACANVAILVIAQWTIREHEIAIRASLGATRGRVVRALLAESVVIAVLGGTLGVGVTLSFIKIIAANAGGDVRFFDLSIEPHILIEALLITVLTGIVSGIGPACLETRRLHTNPMRTLMTSDRVRQRWRHALVVMEIAVTVALFVVAGGLLGSYQRQLSRDTGFNPHPLIALRVENPGGVTASRVVDAITRIPGVAAVSAASSVPYMGSGSLETVSNDTAGSGGVRAENVSIGPSFFAALNVPIRAGRAFTTADTPLTHTAIVNELLAARLFPGRSAIGRQVWLRAVAYEIVGVVEQYVNLALQRPDLDPKLYLPLSDGGNATQATFLIRAAADPSLLARSLRHEVPASAPGNAVANLFTLDEIITVAGQEILVGTAPLAPLVATGVMLTVAGIYGVLAFAVARRSKELALRIAIGAGARDIVQLVTFHSLRLVTLGTGLGIAATFALSRIVRASGGGGSFLDPDWPAFVLPVVLIAMIGVAATLVPSRRALRIDPSVLLRTM